MLLFFLQKYEFIIITTIYFTFFSFLMGSLTGYFFCKLNKFSFFLFVELPYPHSELRDAMEVCVNYLMKVQSFSINANLYTNKQLRCNVRR